jgi:hypothetical protein
MTLTCQCCGFSQTFESNQEAFEAGWDGPGYFTGYVCCNLCPGSFVVLGITDQHKPDHEKWEREGRPAEFQIPMCDLKGQS